jgi:predicted nucleic acid-binding protein
VIYFDTNYILKCYLTEHGSPEATAVFQQNAGNIACSRVGRVEWHATIRRKLITTELSAADVTRIRTQMDEDETAGLWTWLPFEETLLDGLAAWLRTNPFFGGLKALDAVHLESARLGGITDIYSNDGQVKAAASVFGLVANDVIPPVP